MPWKLHYVVDKKHCGRTISKIHEGENQFRMVVMIKGIKK